ncbi:MAG TPA: exodeoxyribonuclease VII small subunit [Candidatus Onthoplasma faecigallinarum]|nr:exodeoxyribonuclease VII small subunit [Candidatus Onthoplasma faecigallinarum]
MLEQNIKRLEEIAKILENGTNLDESLKLYEEGCKLAKTCLKDLEKAKGKIVMIKKNFNEKDDKNE